VILTVQLILLLHTQVPLDVLQHLAEGLSEVKEGGGKKPPLPPAWEKRMRELLLRPSTVQRLLSLQTPIEECQQSLAKSMVDGLKKAQETQGASPQSAVLAAALSQAPQEPPVRYVAVAGIDGDALKKSALELLPDLNLSKVCKL
jgi:hypothetical protein